MTVEWEVEECFQECSHALDSAYQLMFGSATDDFIHGRTLGGRPQPSLAL